MQLSKWTEATFDLLIKILRQALRIGTFFDWSSIILNNLHLEIDYVFGVGPIKRKVQAAGGRKVLTKTIKLPTGYSAFPKLLGLGDDEIHDILRDAFRKKWVAAQIIDAASKQKNRRYVKICVAAAVKQFLKIQIPGVNPKGKPIPDTAISTSRLEEQIQFLMRRGGDATKFMVVCKYYSHIL